MLIMADILSIKSIAIDVAAKAVLDVCASSCAYRSASKAVYAIMKLVLVRRMHGDS